jgi:kinetochore protein NDC80
MAPSSGMGPVIKDTRPIRNQQFQQACQQNVHDFLAQSRAQFPMTAKTFTSPTQREFQLIFVHLIKVLFDGDYAFKQFDTDCLALLKDLRYPGVDNCGKTAMVAPGTPQHWPHLIAMLNWLVDLCKVGYTV